MIRCWNGNHFANLHFWFLVVISNCRYSIIKAILFGKLKKTKTNKQRKKYKKQLVLKKSKTKKFKKKKVFLRQNHFYVIPLIETFSQPTQKRRKYALKCLSFDFKDFLDWSKMEVVTTFFKMSQRVFQETSSRLP